MRNITAQEWQYYEDHAYQNLTPSLIGCLIVGLVLSYVAIALRCYARRISDAEFGKDDILCILSLLPVTAMAIAGLVSPRYGFGKHIVFAKDLHAFVAVILTGVVAYVIATMLIKSSILCFYCRIFTQNKTLKRLAYAIIVWAALWTDKEGRCINIVTPEAVLGIFNILTDTLILLIPVRLVLRLQMSVTRKIQVCGVFLTGAIIIVFSILRVVAVVVASPSDATYDYIWPAIGFYCEMFIGLIAACLPTYSIFFEKGIFMSITAIARGRLSRTFGKISRSNRAVEYDTSHIVEKHRTLPEPPVRHILSHEVPLRRTVSCMPAPREDDTSSLPPRLPSWRPGSPMSFTYEDLEQHFMEPSQET